MTEPLQEAQDTLVKLFKDIYFKAGAPLSFKDELQVRGTAAALVSAITREVLAKLPKPEPAPVAPPATKPDGAGDPFQRKPADPPAPPEKKGFFSGLVQSKVVPSPHKKK